MAHYNPNESVIAYEVIASGLKQIHVQDTFGDCVEDGEHWPCNTIKLLNHIEDTLTAAQATLQRVYMRDVECVEVIDAEGRAFTQRYYPGVEMHLHDRGRLLKIYAGAPKPDIAAITGAIPHV